VLRYESCASSRRQRAQLQESTVRIQQVLSAFVSYSSLLSVWSLQCKNYREEI
jgi:hypothetical protein